MLGKIKIRDTDFIVNIDLLRTDDLKEKVRKVIRKYALTKVYIEKVNGQYIFRYIDKNGIKQKQKSGNDSNKEFDLYINHIKEYIPQMELEDFKRLLKEEDVCAIVKPCDFNISL